MAKMTIDAEKVETLRADDRGRVYLGSKYAGESVEVATIGIVTPDGEECDTETDAESEIQCPKCGDSDLAIEEMDAGDSRIYCTNCGCTLQVG